jgi:hypothetical protein
MGDILQVSGSTNGKSDGSPTATNRMNPPQQNKEEIDDENHNTTNE